MYAGFNVIAVFNKSCNSVLMCKRRKDPYKGLYNFVGGKIEADEDGLQAAYRELREETGIGEGDIVLIHLMDFVYHLADETVEVYVGRLTKEVEVVGEENDLEWLGLHQDFFDPARFAGEGNIGHIMEHVRLSRAISLE